LDFTSTIISNLRASAEFGFGHGRRSNAIYYLGADLDLRSTVTGLPDLNCYLRLKLN
jgi:hypothetical protein